MYKLHLGCGETYFPGYVNIDYPPAHHTVQRKHRIDLYADIKHLHFKDNSITEIRSHHVFEHFDRITALKMLIEWYQWLDEGGVLIIETPDFKSSLRHFNYLGTFKSQMMALRHLFGSQEAAWAYHLDGWYKEKFVAYLREMGYSDLQFKYGSWKGTYNITVSSKKKPPYKDVTELRESAINLLKYGLVDDSETESRLLDIWINELDKSLTTLL